VWSPVDKVAVLVGGLDLTNGTLSTALWALDPDAAEQENPFSKLATYGDVPPGVMEPVFTVDTTSTGWLVGRFDLSEGGEGDNGQTQLRVYSLDLTGYTWSLRWDEASGEGGPVGALHVLGGAGPDGLSLLALSPEGGLSLWAFEPETDAFTELEVQGDVSSVTSLVSWLYDPQRHALMVTSLSSSGPETWRIELSDGVVEPIPTVSGWPGNLEGVATGLNATSGAVFVGGHDPGGYTTSTWSMVAQNCP